MSNAKGKVWIVGKLENPKSQHWHWRKQQKWAAGWREVTACLCKDLLPGVAPEVPKRIRFTAHVKRRFDADGLQMALSAIRDGLQTPQTVERRYRAGFAGTRTKTIHIPGASVIHNDGVKSGHVFEYQQIVDQERQGVWIEVDLVT